MLKIRMQRVGRINSPAFRIVVIEHARSPKAGNFLERLGTYDPRSKVRVLDAERIKYWISKGAQLSGTMHNMLISAGIMEGKKKNVLPKKSPPKKEEAGDGAAAATAAVVATAGGDKKAEEPESAPDAPEAPTAPADAVAVDAGGAAAGDGSAGGSDGGAA